MQMEFLAGRGRHTDIRYCTIVLFGVVDVFVFWWMLSGFGMMLRFQPK